MIIRFARLLLVLTFASGVAFSAHAATNAEMQSASERLVVRAAKAGTAETSRKLYEQALVANPANADALSGLGHLYVLTNKPAVARKYFNSALTVDPDNVSALGGIGLLNLADGKRSAAEENYTVLKTVCAACRETSALGAKLSNTLNVSPTDKP